MLRTALPDDAAAVSQLLKRSYERLMAGSYTERELAAFLPLITQAQPELLASGTYYVVEISGSLVGAGGWTRTTPGSGTISRATAHIRHVAVDPDHLRLGIGRRLLNHSIDQAVAQGVRLIMCFSSLNAVEFYESFGFKPLEPIEIDMGASCSMSAIKMELPIQP